MPKLMEHATGHGDILARLEATIAQRRLGDPTASYVAKLNAKGIAKIAQKVGEEAVELVIEAKDDNDELFLNEAADLLYHYLILMILLVLRLCQVLQISIKLILI